MFFNFHKKLNRSYICTKVSTNLYSVYIVMLLIKIKTNVSNSYMCVCICMYVLISCMPLIVRCLLDFYIILTIACILTKWLIYMSILIKLTKIQNSSNPCWFSWHLARTWSTEFWVHILMLMRKPCLITRIFHVIFGLCLKILYDKIIWYIFIN